MRRVPIRMKLAAALLVPLVALVAVTLVEALTISGDVAEIKDEAEMAERMLGPSSLVTMLEHERDAAGVHLLGQERNFSLPVEDNAQARAELDEALEGFRADLRSRSDLAEVYGPAVDALDRIPDLRAQVDAVSDRERTLDNTAAADEVFTGYSEIMEQLFTADRQVARSIEDADLRRGAELYDLSARQTDAVARLVRDLLLPAVAGEANGLDDSGEIATVARVLAEVRANDAQIRLTAQGAYEPLATALYEADHVVRFPRLAADALETGEVDLTEVMAASTGPDPSAEGYTAFRSDVSDMLRQQAEDVRAAADARRLRYLGLAVLAVAVAVAIMWVVSRSITGPLRSLTRQAQDMAGRRLPAAVREILETPLGDDVVVPDVVPVAVRTRDEVADVVAALNTVQESALDLAVEQAVLRRNIADSFVNLGRRNQNLLGRQLDFITELESNETDPDTLASLFRLDHLATRMRRNAESLLVLAGIEPPRKWAAPVRLTDVIRSALGEVEDYQRVVLRAVEPATVLGSAAADLAHLIAEFVENALTFSPPDVPVEVFGGPRSEGGYRLSITDAGVGMSPADLEEANRRLAGAESFTVAPSKYLGHYVAANLALRHGVTVTLAQRQPGTGVVVTIELPVGLLTDDGEPANVPVPEQRPARAGVSAGTGAAGPAGGSPLDVSGPDIYAAPPQAEAPAGLPVRGPRPAQPTAGAPPVTASGLPIRQRGGASTPDPTASDAEHPTTPAGLPIRARGGAAGAPTNADGEHPTTSGGLATRRPGGPATSESAEHAAAQGGPAPTDANGDRPGNPPGGPADATRPTAAGPDAHTVSGLPKRTPAGDAPPTQAPRAAGEPDLAPTAEAPTVGWPTLDPPADGPAAGPEGGPAAGWPTSEPAAESHRADAAGEADDAEPAPAGWMPPAPAAGEPGGAGAAPAGEAATWATPAPAAGEPGGPPTAPAGDAAGGEWRLVQGPGASGAGGIDVPEGDRTHGGSPHVPPRRTRSGLPVRRPASGRRAPAPAGSGDAVLARVRAQDDLLVALRGRPVPPPHEAPVPAGNGTNVQTNGGLARRVPGAQLPDTHGPRLRRGPGRRGGPAQPNPPAAEDAGDREQQLHDLLRHFTEGRDKAHDES